MNGDEFEPTTKMTVVDTVKLQLDTLKGWRGWKVILSFEILDQGYNSLFNYDMEVDENMKVEEEFGMGQMTEAHWAGTKPVSKPVKCLANISIW